MPMERFSSGHMVEFEIAGEERKGVIEEVDEESVVVHPPTDPNTLERVPKEDITNIEPLSVMLTVTNPETYGSVGAVEVYTQFPHDQLLHMVDVEENFDFDITAVLDEMGYEIVPKEEP